MIGGPMSGVVWSLMTDWQKTKKRGASRRDQETNEPKTKAGDRKV